MARKRYKPEEIVAKLRQVDVCMNCTGNTSGIAARRASHGLECITSSHRKINKALS